MYTGWSPTYIAIDVLWVGFRLVYFIRHQYYCQKSEPLRTYKQRFCTFYDVSRARPPLLFSNPLQPLPGNVVYQISHTAGVAPLVVVPGDDLNQISFQNLGELGIHDAGAGIALVV